MVVWRGGFGPVYESNVTTMLWMCMDRSYWGLQEPRHGLHPWSTGWRSGSATAWGHWRRNASVEAIEWWSYRTGSAGQLIEQEKDEQLRRVRTERDPRAIGLFDGSYNFGRANVVQLSQLISSRLENQPGYINTNKIFNCVQACFRDWKVGYRDNPEHYHVDMKMLMMTCLTSTWFSDNQRGQIRLWWVSFSVYYHICTPNAYPLTPYLERNHLDLYVTYFARINDTLWTIEIRPVRSCFGSCSFSMLIPESSWFLWLWLHDMYQLVLFPQIVIRHRI